MRKSSKPDVWKHDTSSHTKVNNRNKTLTLRNGTQNAKIGVKEVDILKPVSLPTRRLGNKCGRKNNNNVKLLLTADEIASALMSDDEDTSDTVVSKQNNKNKKLTVRPTTEQPTFVSNDEDNNDAENSMMQQYLSKNTVVKNTRKLVISKATHLRDFNNSQNSQDDGYEKCFRCDQRFCTTDGTYHKHSKQCLDKTNLETTIG